MNIGSFFVTLGVNADTFKVKDFAKAIGDLPLEAAAAIVAIGGIEYKLAELAQQVIHTATNLSIFRAETGLSTQDLQKWQLAAERAGISGDTVAASLKTLQQNMVAIRFGAGNSKPFMALGIDPTKSNPFAVLTQLRKVMKEMPRETFAYWSAQLGVSGEMLRVLELTDQEFLKFASHVKTISPDQERTFLRFKSNLVAIGQTIKYNFAVHFESFIIAMERIKSDLSSLAPLFPAFAAGLALITAGFLPITAAITSLLLLLDDLATYVAGGDSLIGRAFGPYKKGEIGDIISGKKKPNFDFSKTPIYFPSIKAFGEKLDNAVSNVYNITVHTLDEADKVGEAVANAIKKMNGQAEQNSNNQGH